MSSSCPPRTIIRLSGRYVDILGRRRVYPEMGNDFSGKFLKAARMLVRLKQEDVAVELKIDRRILARLELSENQKVDVPLFSKIRSFYERRGIEFIAATSTHGTGIRIKSPDNEVDESVPKQIQTEDDQNSQ